MLRLVRVTSLSKTDFCRLGTSLVLLLSVLPVQCQQPEQSGQKPNSAVSAKQTYQQLVERVKAGDSTVDFVELISAASDWELSEKELIKAPNRDEMATAFKNKDYKKATQFVEGVLDYEFTNRGLHRAAENAYRQIGDNGRAEFHHNIGEKLLNALLSTGDGKSAETAYCVQGINEEYQIMNHFDYQVDSQALVMANGAEYDVLSGTDRKSKKSVSLYFDISGFFKRCVKSHRKDQQ